MTNSCDPGCPDRDAEVLLEGVALTVESLLQSSSQEILSYETDGPGFPLLHSMWPSPQRIFPLQPLTGSLSPGRRALTSPRACAGRLEGAGW